MSLRNPPKNRLLLFCLVMMLGVFLLIGCSGKDGAKGDTGATGATGAQGEPGPVTTTNESCAVCHSAGKIADIAVAHPDPTAADVTVSNITLTNTGGVAEVSFHVATDSGAVTDLTMDNLRFYLADLVPAKRATTSWGTWDSPYFERWAYERNGTDRSGNPYLYGTFDDADATNGNYTYTFLTGFGSTEAMAEAPDYNVGDTQRLMITVSGEAGVTNNSVGFLDFTVPTDGNTAVAMDSQRLFVTADACKKCHGPQFDEAAHASTYLDTRGCVICHSPLGHYGTEMQADDAYLPVLIHQIHAAIDNPAFEEEVYKLGFGGVTYPQDIKDCVVCHTDSGLNLGTGNEIDNWKEHPTMEICGSCHTDINFATGANHDGGVQTDNTQCNACHLNGTSFSKSVTQAHDTTPTGAIKSEFNVSIAISNPANGSYFVAGETPMVTVTMTPADGGANVDYTAAQGETGSRDGILSEANLYVYGPRAKAVPVLTLGSTTDPAFDAETDTATQSHALFVGSDAQVKTDSSGFKYQLLAIPTDMKPGTYMIRVEAADYGAVAADDWVTTSGNLITFQVGTATVEDKVAGDSCVNCHGATHMHQTGTHAHNVPFDTDYCLACHDQSGNYAIPIANRVHAVHSGNSDGDIYTIQGGSRDWSDVTYPQDIARCVTCHTSGDTTYKTLPFMMPCAGCHVGDGGVQIQEEYPYIGGPDVIDHMIQNGGPYVPASES